MAEDFVRLFQQHWAAGTGNPRNGCWTAKGFSDAMGKAGCEASIDAISNWHKGINRPRQPQANAILKVFFANATPDTCPDICAMQAAWERMKPSRIASAEEEAAPGNPTEWPRETTPPIAGLAELQVFTPTSDNAGGHFLGGRIQLGLAEVEHDGKSMVIGLREARLTLGHSTSVQTEGSEAGTADAPHENLERIAGEWRVVGPKEKPDGYLDGEVLAGRHLVKLVPTETSKAEEVTLTLAVPRRSFEVAPADPNGKPAGKVADSAAKDAILNLFLERQVRTKDASGRPILQKATLKRRPPA